MAFMDSLGYAAGKAVQLANEKAEKFNLEYEKHCIRAARMSDEQLVRAYRGVRSTAERAALQRELKDRGLWKA